MMPPAKLVSLTQKLAPGCPTWPGDPPLMCQAVADLKRDGYFLNLWSVGEHVGTHVNAPRHFFADGADVSAQAWPLFLPAVVLRKENIAAEAQLTVADVTSWEQKYGRIEADSLVLFATGWGEHWRDAATYLGTDEFGTLHFPGFHPEAAQRLLRERRVAGLGIDTHGVDVGYDKTYAVNHLALHLGRLVLENLANLTLLPPRGAWVLVDALPLAGASGAPALVNAFLPEPLR